MGSTLKTPNYELSQFVATDRPSWLGDYDQDMRKIDIAIADVKVTADKAGADADTAATSATQAEQAATKAQQAATEASASAATANTTATQSMTTANQAISDAKAAKDAADAAQTTANTANSAAGAAQTSANSAQTSANQAKSDAQSALSGVSANQTNISNLQTTINSYDQQTQPTFAVVAESGLSVNIDNMFALKLSSTTGIISGSFTVQDRTIGTYRILGENLPVFARKAAGTGSIYNANLTDVQRTQVMIRSDGSGGIRISPTIINTPIQSGAVMVQFVAIFSSN